jgi:adenylate kinase
MFLCTEPCRNTIDRQEKKMSYQTDHQDVLQSLREQLDAARAAYTAASAEFDSMVKEVPERNSAARWSCSHP